ncbi:hypothetical protein, partial [Paraburkholderia sp. XV]|uniref:hypothetical protein n=1 Tax=Paraburkholderia sp. XV TaxID=2831520 RepID=UPI001CD60EA9
CLLHRDILRDHLANVTEPRAAHVARSSRGNEKRPVGGPYKPRKTIHYFADRPSNRQHRLEAAWNYSNIESPGVERNDADMHTLRCCANRFVIFARHAPCMKCCIVASTCMV